jgi:two-component system nitrate/nitrite response regulator NarL
MEIDRMNKTSIFLAEGQAYVRDALALMLDHQPEFRVVGFADSAETLLDQLDGLNPDAILLDWDLAALTAESTIPALRACCPHCCLLMTSVRAELANHIERFGVDGFLSKQLSPDDFTATLRGFVQSKEENEKKAD